MATAATTEAIARPTMQSHDDSALEIENQSKSISEEIEMTIRPNLAHAAAKALVASRLLSHEIPVYEPIGKDKSRRLTAEIDGGFVTVRVELAKSPNLSAEYLGFKADALALVCLATENIQWLSANKSRALSPTLQNMNVKAGEELLVRK